KAAEVRPGNPRVVHHMKAWIRPPGSGWLKNAPEGELVKPTGGEFAEGAGPAQASNKPRAVQEILAKYNPGVTPQEFTLDGAAKFIAAGSDIVFECHYTPNGKAETDRSKVGIVFANTEPQKRYVTITGVNTRNFVIPPHASNYEVKAEATLASDAEL